MSRFIFVVLSFMFLIGCDLEEIQRTRCSQIGAALETKSKYVKELGDCFVLCKDGWEYSEVGCRTRSFRK